MEKVFLTLLVLFLCFSLVGCGAHAKFIYPHDYKTLLQLYNKPKYAVNVGVLPFEDERGDVNNSGGYMLYLIPLMPFGRAHYNRPEAAESFNTISRFDFSPSEDLAKAIATSLRKANIFGNVYFSYGGDKSDFLVTGNILSTEYKGTIYSYGLSVFGPNLWFLGIPCGSSYNQLALNLYLKDGETKDILWEYSFDKENKITQGLYYRFGRDAKAYSTMMQEGANEAVASLAEFLENTPPKKLKK